MSQGIKTQEQTEKEGGGFLHHLFERASTSDVHSASGREVGTRPQRYSRVHSPWL